MNQRGETNVTILDQFTPQVLGVFWITRDELNRDLPGFDNFNYLFDGLISQYLYGQEDHQEKHAHIFFTENFQDRIFLAHLKAKELTKSQIAGDIDEQIALIQSTKSEKKIILVMDSTEHEWPSELKKRYPQFEFRALDITQ
jgi:hypothetical protein